MVGHNPDKTLRKYVGENYLDYCELAVAFQDYNSPAEYTNVNGIEVDSTYEGKVCLPLRRCMITSQVTF